MNLPFLTCRFLQLIHRTKTFRIIHKVHLYKEHPSLHKTLAKCGCQATNSTRKSAHVEIFHPHLAEYILDMAECEEACRGISSGSPFPFGDSQGNLFSSDSIPLSQVVSYEAFSHVQPLLARVYLI